MPGEHDELVATLARERRAIAALETECGRSAEIREKFWQVLSDLNDATAQVKSQSASVPADSQRRK